MRCFTFIAMLCCALVASAQLKQDSVRVYFRQDKYAVDARYLNNKENFSRLDELYLKYTRHSKYWLKGIRVVSSASPEATFKYNEYLANRRVEAVLNYLSKHTLIDPSLMQLQPLGEDWKSLRRLVEADAQVPYRDEVLASLDRYPDGQEWEWDLKGIAGGVSYQYLYHHIYPLLRQTNVVFDVVHEREYEYPVKTLPVPPVPFLLVKEPPLLVFVPEEYDTRTILALKTNLLYDLVSWLNFAVEVPIKDNYSVLYYHQFPWWTWGEGNNEYCMRFLSIGAEARWWFKPMPREKTEKRIKRDKLMGHFFGVYGESGKWDFERKRDICYQGEHWSAGLSYGYAMPIGKRLNLELSVSAGYASIVRRGYEPAADYSELYHLPEKDGTWHYIGPTKAQVTLVLPITVKVKKGGGQ